LHINSWSRLELHQPPSQCHRDALLTELRPLVVRCPSGATGNRTLISAMRTQCSPVELSPHSSFVIVSFLRAFGRCFVERDRRNDAPITATRALVDVLTHPFPEANRTCVARNRARTVNTSRGGMRRPLTERTSRHRNHLHWAGREGIEPSLRVLEARPVTMTLRPESFLSSVTEQRLVRESDPSHSIDSGTATPVASRGSIDRGRSV
jgi:hypothetical protein